MRFVSHDRHFPGGNNLPALVLQQVRVMKTSFRIAVGLCCVVLTVCTLALLKECAKHVDDNVKGVFEGAAQNVKGSLKADAGSLNPLKKNSSDPPLPVLWKLRPGGANCQISIFIKMGLGADSAQAARDCHTFNELQHWHEAVSLGRGCPARTALLDRLARGLPTANECEYGNSNSPRYENCFIRAIALMSFGPVDSPASNPFWTEYTDAMANVLCHDDKERCRVTKDCLHKVLQKWNHWSTHNLFYAARKLHLDSPDAHAMDNKWSQVTVFKRLGLKQPGLIYAGEDPGYSERHPPDAGYPPPLPFDPAALTAAITALPLKNFVVKPLNCWQNNGIHFVTDEAWRAGNVTMPVIVQRAKEAAKMRCKFPTGYTGDRRWAADGPAGIGVFELTKFLFELRVFVAGGLMYGALHSHAANAHGGNKPRYYIFPDGASGWSGCQHSELRASHDRCVAHLRKTEPWRLPQEGVAERINTEAQARLAELKRESERVARELGVSFVRIDWFVDSNGLIINEVELGSALELPGKSTKLYPMLFAGSILHQQRQFGVGRFDQSTR